MIDGRRGVGVALAFVTACVSGVAVFVNGYGVTRFGDATVYTTVKNAVAAVLILGLAAAVAIGRRRGGGPAGPRPAPRVTVGRRLGIAYVGLVGGGVAFALFFEGLARSSSPPQAALIHKTLLVWVAILAVPLLHERFTAVHAGAVALLVAGQLALGATGEGLTWGLGEWLVLAATLLWAGEVVVAKWLLGGISSMELGVVRLGIGTVALVAWLAASGRLSDLTSLSGEQWAWAALTGAILTVYVATWFAALARAQAVDVTAVLVFGALITALLDAGVQGAALAPQAWGLILITVGTAAAAAAALRRPALADR